MRLGLTYWRVDNLSAQSVLAQASLGESLGFQSFWLPENHFNDTALPDPLLLLSAVAAGTSSILLGTSSYLLPLRNPLLAAEQVATLDRLTNGRVILGVGRGYANGTLKAFNVKPAEKRERFEWCLKTMIKAWKGDTISLREDDNAPVIVRPSPVQKPHPPIWIAAFGPKALQQAGTLGLPYIASPIETFKQLKKNMEIFQNAVLEAGHKPIATRPVMRTVYVCDDHSELQTLKRAIGKAKMPAGLETSSNIDEWAIIGDKQYVQEKILQYKEELKITDLIVTRLRLARIPDKSYRQSLENIATMER